MASIRGYLLSTSERLHTDMTPIDVLASEVRKQTKIGPGVEPETAAMFGALALEYDNETNTPATGRPVTDLLKYAAEQTLTERGVHQGAAVSLLRTCLVHYYYQQAAEQGETFSDSGMIDVAEWRPHVHELATALKDDDSLAVSSLLGSLSYFNASTPMASRYYPADMITQVIAERWPNGARALDIGSSIMAGPLQLMNRDTFPLSFSKVVTATTQHERAVNITKQANALLARDPVIREVVCVDVAPLYSEERQQYDENYRQFAYNGLRPSERNGKYLQDLQVLTDFKRAGSPTYQPGSRVTFHCGDLLNDEDLGIFLQTFPERFDVIMANYVTQELSPVNQARMHRVLSLLLSESGVIIYNHQAYIGGAISTKPASFRQVKHYVSYATQPYQSHMHLLDRLNPHNNEGVQQVMTYLDNRCRTAAVGYNGRLVVNGKPEPIIDLIRHS